MRTTRRPRFTESSIISHLFRTVAFLVMFLPFYFSTLTAQNLHAQELPAFNCGMREPAVSSLAKSIEPHTGAHLPTHGRIRGRVIFVQAQNDVVEHPDWPLGGMPDWANSYAERVQRYFSDMSNSELQVQLDLHPDVMVTRSGEDDYVYWQRNFGHAIMEILDSLDQTVDFSEYDLWDSEGKPYRIQAGPDGKVDLLIFIFRSIANTTFLPFSGVSDLGFEGYHFLDGTLGRWVYGGTGQFNDASSSGITICRSPGYRMVIEEEFAFQVTVHEFGHKLFGEGHPAEIFGGLGVMANAGNGYAMNSFERHLAGYIDFAETLPGVDTTVVLRDYVTTGEALLIPLPSLPRGYYSLEFRARFSEWDSAPVPGLYAFRVYDSWSRNQKKVELISAEGKYEWALDSATNSIYPSRSSPLKGYSRFQRIPLNGKNYWADGWWGDARSAFTLAQPYFSVLRNPSPDFMNGADTVRTGLHITLLALDDRSATVRISYQTPTILDVPALPERGFAMSPPYPHPLRQNDHGTIPLRIDRGGTMRLHLHDVLGRQQRVLYNGRVEAGTLLLPFSTDGLSAGMYTIVMETDEGSSAGTFMIAR